jgi:hypothetical protein
MRIAIVRADRHRASAIASDGAQHNNVSQGQDSEELRAGTRIASQAHEM